MKKLSYIFFVAVLLASCASAPKVSFSPEQENRELSILPAGAKIYLWVDAVEGRPLLDAFSSVYFSGDGMATVLDNTRSAGAAIFPEQNQGRRFFLAASGSYPRFMANFSLLFSRGWKRQKSDGGSSFWYSQNDRIALALGSNLALVSDADPHEDFPFETSPKGFAEFSRGRVLSGWINDPADSLNVFLSSMGIPLQMPAEDFFFGAVKSSQSPGKDWDLYFRIRTPTTAQARSLLALFSMARLFAGQQTTFDENEFFMSPQEAVALFFSNAPEQDGDALVLRLGPMSETRIALLFNIFSLYSS